MVFGWLTKETKSAYIARPPEFAQQLIYLHPDKSIPRGAKLTVRSDECVLFFREGQFIGRIDAGTVLLDTANIPFLGHLLIDNFTDGNHFICELFFVSLSEIIFHVARSPLGQYKDTNSANVVAVNGSFSYTVRVTDPRSVVIDIGGQNNDAGGKISQVFNGRMLNQVRKAVGIRTQVRSVMDVVSNMESEAISQEVQKLGHAEFTQVGIGIGRIFDLALELDGESLALLREFGKQESGLALQAKGMRLATGEGFAEYNLIQGQRAALEGLGRGLGTGNAPMVMGGFNIGANLTGGGGHPISRSTPQMRQGTVLTTQATYVLRGDGGDTGPFTPRQLALMAISKGLPLSELQIRGADDPPDVQYSADLEPQILAEYKRRAPPPTVPPKPGHQGGTTREAAAAATPAAGIGSPGEQAFSMTFAATVKNGQLTLAEIETLTNLAVSLGLDADSSVAKARVSSLIQANHLRIVV